MPCTVNLFIFVSSFYEIRIMAKKNFTEEQEKLAHYNKALGHPVRVFIMEYLVKNASKCCYSGDMIENLPIARSTLSEHLKELKKAGFIQGEINPPYIKYCINKENWEDAKKMVMDFYSINND